MVPNYPRPATVHGLASLSFIHEFLTCGPSAWPNVPISETIHISDCAKAHVLALDKGPLPAGQHKRLLVSCGLFTWPMAADLLRKERPELAVRLPGVDVTPPLQTVAPMDTSLAEEVLGIDSWIPWERAVLDGVDEVVSWMKHSPK